MEVLAAGVRVENCRQFGGLPFVFGLAHAATSWDGAQPGWYLILLPVLGGLSAALGRLLHPAVEEARLY